MHRTNLSENNLWIIRSFYALWIFVLMSEQVYIRKMIWYSPAVKLISIANQKCGYLWPITKKEYFTKSFGMQILEWSNQGYRRKTKYILFLNFLNYKWTLFNPTQIIFTHLKYLYPWKATNCSVKFNNFDENRFEEMMGYSKSRKKLTS